MDMQTFPCLILAEGNRHDILYLNNIFDSSFLVFLLFILCNKKYILWCFLSFGHMCYHSMLGMSSLMYNV